MQDLISQLKLLEGEGKRSSISIIQELNENIRQAQDMGYRVAAIHEEIAKTVDIDLGSFKTLLYRVRKKLNSNASSSKQVPVTQQADSDSTTENKSTTTGHLKHKDLTAATERSKNKLASFGKGK